MRGQRNSAGFTLIEVMAVVALISVVFLVALNFYTDLSRASARATKRTREIRHATAILDRVARDFEGARLFVKPPEMDPLEHPWLFVAESRTESSGADHLKFVSRNHDPMRTDAPETNLAIVAYMAKRNDQDRISLYRWSSPHLPESLEKEFPDENDERSFLIADDLATFGVNLQGTESGLSSEWDSTTILQSGQLPTAVEIQLTLAGEHDNAREDDSLDEPSQGDLYERKVWLPIRPVQIALLTDPESTLNGGTSEGDFTETGVDEEEGSTKPGDKPRENLTCKSGKMLMDCVNCGAASGQSVMACTVWGLFPACFEPSNIPALLQPIVRPECL